ncbi:MAG TPA: hypothetical protein VK419_07345, partial [Bryobacteraceae bacterium]|nr:hypothetical protein [Bryobacteraceae bacterium]
PHAEIQHLTPVSLSETEADEAAPVTKPREFARDLRSMAQVSIVSLPIFGARHGRRPNCRN